MRPTRRFFWALLTIFLLSSTARAAFIMQYSSLYHTYTDDVTDMEYSRMNNYFFAGASVGRQNKLYLGPSYQMWSKTHTASEGASENEVSFTEFGATIMYYFDADRRWKIEGTYNLSVKGERSDGTTTAELDGSGYRIGFSYQFPVNKNISLGAGIYYHTVSISSNVVEETQSEEAESYTSTTPMLEFNFRFF